jgi:hypothetical protein
MKTPMAPINLGMCSNLMPPWSSKETAVTPIQDETGRMKIYQSPIPALSLFEGYLRACFQFVGYVPSQHLGLIFRHEYFLILSGAEASAL